MALTATNSTKLQQQYTIFYQSVCQPTNQQYLVMMTMISTATNHDDDDESSFQPLEHWQKSTHVAEKKETLLPTFIAS